MSPDAVTFVQQVTAAPEQLEDWGTLDEATGAEMRTSGIEMWSAGEQSAGIWRCTPGPSRWSFETVAEFIHVLDGSMTVTADGAEPVRVGAGDLAVFPRGWSGTWEIHEPLTKAYVIY
jgi:uncharacterized cupin superfamily protein